jgi:hypothetical protein
MSASICTAGKAAFGGQEGYRSLVGWGENDICRIREVKLLRIVNQLLTVGAIDMMQVFKMS